MVMKKALLHTAIMLLPLLSGFLRLSAQPVRPDVAGEIAKTVYWQYIERKSPEAREVEPSERFVRIHGDDTVYYVFNFPEQKGFIILSADERAYPVLAYSREGSYHESNQPPAFAAWMTRKASEISFLIASQIPQTNKVQKEWFRIKSGYMPGTTTGISKLLKTTWDQGCYYNGECPEDVGGPCGRTPTGCVATAMAQIMRYWNFPLRGTSSHAYIHPTYGPQYANFGATNYAWSAMPEHPTVINPALDELMYHCGVSVNMNYGTTISTAFDPRDEFVSYFRYHPSAQYLSKNNYTDSAWKHMLRSEMNSLRPVWYSGNEGSGTTGHAFVCDGYEGDDHFHFNWGWDGNFDGYFYLNDLTPSIYNFTSNQEGIFSLFPSTSLPEISRLEYFIDTDPGYGNGTEVTVPADSLVVHTFNIPLLSISSGVHVLYLRCRDDNGRWSVTETMPFYRLKTEVKNIASMEYFIDTDPGTGNGIPIAIDPNSGQSVAAVTIPLANVTMGIHTLFIRAKDNYNRWSLVQSSSFYKADVPVQQLSRLEYFIDSDPGTGNGIPVILQNTANETASFLIDLANLNNGIHTLYIRAKDLNQVWSITANIPFYRLSGITEKNITALEVFIDTDPGHGQATQVQVYQPASWFQQTFTVDLSCYPTGDHKLYIRTRDDQLHWSLTNMKPVTISVLPPTITVVGSLFLCEGESVLLKVPKGEGRIYKWLRNNTPLPGEADSTLETTLAGIYECVINHSNICQDTTAPVEVVVYQHSVGGNITGGARICKGSQTGLLSLYGQTGIVQKWQKRHNYGGWTDIAHTGITYQETPVYSGTWEYRTQVKNGTCPPEFSNPVTVVVDTTVITGPISGISELCQGTSAVNYYIQPVWNATGYNWTLPPGATIVSGENSNSIYVNFSYTALPGIIQVTGINTCGAGVPSPGFMVNVKPVPIPAITGSSSVCIGSTGMIYHTETGMTNYIWNVSSGGTITSGGTPVDNTVTVTWNTAGPQTVSVNYTNAHGCIAASETVLPITVHTLPVPSLIGPSLVCAATVDNVYTTESGMTSYVWNVSSGGTITSGGTPADNTVTVAWNAAGSQSVFVNYTNANGCTAAMATEQPVTVNPRPVPTINGPVTICAATVGNVYTTESGMTNYVWNVSAGGTIIAGGTLADNTVSITWNTAGSQSVSVNYADANGCSAGTATELPVTVNPLPVPTLSGPATACVTTTGNVYTTEAGMTNYVWNVSSGGTITSGGTPVDNTVTVTWNTAGPQSVSINYINTHGCTAATATVLSITVNPLPVPSLIGPSLVCAATVDNVYTTESGMTSYVWNVSSGGTITSGGTPADNTVTVTWNTAGSQSVSVNYTNANGCIADNATERPVTVNPRPVPTINGPVTICAATVGNVYTTEAGMTNYVWNVSPGGTITSGGTPADHTVTVTWNTAGLQSVSVNYADANGCTADNATELPVTVNPLPVPTLSGPVTACITTSGNVYTTETGMTNYIWNVSAGGTITSGGTSADNTVTVTWNSAGPQSVSVNYTNTHGCTAATATVLPITVHTLPVPSVIGPSLVCSETSGNVYTTESGMTSYVWILSPGGTITSGGTPADNTVTVTWNTAGPQSVSVSYTNANGCTADNATELQVTVNPRPIASIEGPEIVCAGTIAMYSTIEGMSHYTWHITGGGIVVSGGTSTSTTTSVIWNTPGNKMIGVKYSNSYGCFSTAYAFKFPVIKPVPVPSLSGNSEVCVGNVYTYTTDAGMSGYVWSVSAGGTIQSGTGTNNVQVLWNFTGNQNVGVNYTNPEGCFAGNPTTLNVLPVTLPLAPGQINGPSMVVQGQENVFYTIVPLANTSQYHWSLPPGVIILSGEGTDSIFVKFSPMALSGIINVNGINTCGAGPLSPDLNIMVNMAQQLQLSNIFLNNGDTTCFNAYQSIIVGGNGSGFAVQNGAYAKFIAGQNIRFLPGTMVYPGGHLWAYITTDSTFCGTQPPSLFNAPENTLTNFTSDKTHGSLFRIYPNPTAGCFKMELNDDPGKSEYVIEIFNLVGKLINRRTIHEASAIECTLQNQPPGVYLFRVVAGDQTGLEKIIKQ